MVSYPTNRFYLSGFELHDGQCNESSGQYPYLQKNGTDILFTDSRFLEVAKSLWKEEHIIIYQNQVEDIRLYLKNAIQGKIGVETTTLSSSFL